MGIVRNYLSRYWRTVLLIAGIIVVLVLIFALRSAIWPFLLGLVIAYVLLPVITWIERRLPPARWRQGKRTALILLFFLLFFGILGFIGFYIITAVGATFSLLLDNITQYISAALDTIQKLTEALRRALPPEIQDRVNALLQQAGTALGNAIRDLFVGGFALLPGTFGFIAGMAALPFFLFYILKDWEKLGASLYSGLPSWAAQHIRNISHILEQVIGRYIRAQLLLGAIVGILDFIGLAILGIQFAPGLGAFAAVTELIPIVGPWLGGAAGVIVTLALSPEKVIWVAIVFASVQLLENNVLVPRIHGGYLQIHPAIAVVLLVVGSYLAGFWGLLLAVPLAATLAQIFKYIIRSAGIEELELPEK